MILFQAIFDTGAVVAEGSGIPERKSALSHLAKVLKPIKATYFRQENGWLTRYPFLAKNSKMSDR